jgi:imidazolonepropionase
MRELGILRDAAVLVLDGRIAQVGSSRDLAGTPAAITLDCPGKVVTPGLVDAHTHALFAGSREDEVAMKAEGLSYQEIAARGGGIRSTLRRTREAADAEILRETRARLAGMMRHGTTTAEVKSGYGLGVAEEVRLLNLMDQLPAPGIPAVVPTFLGAHAVPPEFEGRAEAYAELVSTEMLRGVAGRTSARFCDVWVEEGAFTADQGRRLLKEAQRLGLEGKVHADELTACGGAELAADVGAVSADHCVHATTSGLREMAARGVIAVLLPGTSFSSRLPYADARRLLREDVPVALGTDLSPNSWIESMQTVLWLAAHHSGLTAAEGLTAATVNAAYAVGQGFETGTVEAGKRADLLVLDVPDHRQLGYRHGNLVEVVIAGGRVAAARPPTAPAAR